MKRLGELRQQLIACRQRILYNRALVEPEYKVHFNWLSQECSVAGESE